jgi:MarR family transcriptional regulator, organic hydroperoxide resistance regulator
VNGRTEAEARIRVRGSLEFLQVLWRTSHALERRSRRMEKAIGLTAPQRLVVRFLGRFPGVTAGQLARALHVDPGTLSASLRRLEGRGLVERRRDPADTRRVTLGLTREGRALDVPGPGTVEAAADALLAHASARDLAATVRVLDRFAELLLADDAAAATPFPDAAAGAPARAGLRARPPSAGDTRRFRRSDRRRSAGGRSRR